MRKLVGILLGLYIATHLAACTSKESREDESGAQVEETAADDGELEQTESAGTTADETKAGFVDDQLPDQAMGDQPTSELEAAPATTDDSLAATPPPEETPLTDSSTTTEVSSTEPALTAPPAEEVPAAAADTSMSGVDLGTPVTSTEETLEKKSETVVDQPKKPMASLKKVDDSPRMHKGVPLNGVYVARPGDTYKSIAKMIYQDAGKQSDLKKYNPSISKPNPGDKIYYNSPTRSSDTNVVKNYYEEMGYQPEVYIAQEGDHLPKVAKKLLGYDKAWKEIWVTNAAVDSKDSLMAGTELKYWKKPAVMDQSTNMAANSEMAAPSAPPVPDQQPPPPMNDMAAAVPPVEELPPPPVDAGIPAAATTANELPPPPPPADLPPPPPPAEMAPPPPPPVAAKPPKQEVISEETIGGMSNDDMMMGLAGVGIIAAGVAAMMVIRKRRQQKEMQAAFGDTQIGAS